MGARYAPEEAGEVVTLDEAHVEVELSVDLPEAVDRDAVRLVWLGGQVSLAVRALAGVSGAVDLAHPAASD